jgi:hypothetical protein
MATSKKTSKKPVISARQQGPVVVKNETQAFDVATESGRKRPFVAINDDGKLVVCSRRTAAKYGWESQGALYSRTGSDKKTTPTAKKTKQTTAEEQWEKITSKSNKETQSAPAARNLARSIRRAVRAEFAALTGKRK